MALQACSTDEIGVLTTDYRALLELQWLQNEILNINNYLLRSNGGNMEIAPVFTQVMVLTFLDRDISLIEGLAQETAYAMNAQQMYDEKIYAESERINHQEQYGLLLNSTAEGIYGVDTRGICIFVNSACLRMLGYERPCKLICPV